jgi:hypothetical protein
MVAACESRSSWQVQLFKTCAADGAVSGRFWHLQSLQSDVMAVSALCHGLAAVASLITAAPDTLHRPASRLQGLASLTDSHLSLARRLLQVCMFSGSALLWAVLV